MAKRNIKNKKQQKTIARNRIKKLFTMAEQCALSNKLDLADRYVDLARKISMRYLVPIPKEYKRCFCKHCYCYLLPNVNSRIRVHKGKLIVHCFNCDKYMRMPLK